MCEVFADLEPEGFSSHTRRLRLNGRSTSIRLETAFWQTLDAVAAQEGISTACFISKLHAEFADARSQKINFTSMLRCACLNFTENSPPSVSDPHSIDVGMAH